MRRTPGSPVLSILAAASTALMLVAFFYQPWLTFEGITVASEGVFTPHEILVSVYLRAKSFSGVRLLLREGVGLLGLLPAAMVIALAGLSQKSEGRRALLLVIAGGIGLAVPTLYAAGLRLAFIDTNLILGRGLWLTAIAALGLALLGAATLAVSHRPLQPIRKASGRDQRQARTLPFIDWLEHLPWWLLVTILLGVLIVWSISSNQVYQDVFDVLKNGIVTTIEVTIIAYSLAILVGLLAGLARVSTHPIIYHAASFYVEIVRGVPMLVLLYYITFVVGPALVDVVNATGGWMIDSNLLPDLGAQLAAVPVRDLTFKTRAIIALMLGYGAFLSEIFRAGIESIDKGQMEAARSLGMTYVQAMRYVILPQAIRRVLPPLGNDFIAMLKDSSLVSVLGVRDITLLGQFHLTSSFRFFEVYNTVAFLYLSMTLVLALLVRAMEQRLSRDQPGRPARL